MQEIQAKIWKKEFSLTVGEKQDIKSVDEYVELVLHIVTKGYPDAPDRYD